MVDAVGHLVRADAAQLGLERGEFLAAPVGQRGIDFRQPPRGPVQARDVIAGPGLLAGAPGPEPFGEFVELAHVLRSEPAA